MDLPGQAVDGVTLEAFTPNGTSAFYAKNNNLSSSGMPLEPGIKYAYCLFFYGLQVKLLFFSFLCDDTLEELDRM